MIKKHLFFLKFLFTSISFAYKEIKLADSNLNQLKTINETNYKIPEGFTQDLSFWKSYRDLDFSIQYIIECIDPKDNQQVKALHYSTKKGLQNKQNFLVLQFPSLIHSKGINTNYLSFMWIKKKYNNTTEIEKKIADYYNAKSNDKVEFLYPYLKPNTDPWAIKIGNQLHATIWMNTQIVIKPSQVDPKNPFIVLDPKDEKYEIFLLTDENKQIIAKRINNNTIFKDS